MVEYFNNTLSSALNTAAPLKVQKRSTDRISPLFNNNSVNEIKRICWAAERKWRKTRFTVHCNIYKEAMSAYNKAIHLEGKDYFSKIITKDAGNSIILFSTTPTTQHCPRPPTVLCIKM